MHPSLRLNAAIEKMIIGKDHNAEAAAIVIEYGSKLKAKNDWVFVFRLPFTWPKWLSGNAAGVGDVDIKDETGEKRVYSYGTEKERIGHYRLWKAEEGHIKFHHYWASSLTTSATDDEFPTNYSLFYNPDTLQPTGVALSYIASIRRWSIPHMFEFVHYKKGLKIIHGEVPPQYRDIVDR